MVHANFCDHYPLAKRTLKAWKNWVRRERAPTSLPAAAGAVTVPGRIGPDPELQRIKEEAGKAVPPPADVRERLQALRKPTTEVPA